MFVVHEQRITCARKSPFGSFSGTVEIPLLGGSSSLKATPFCRRPRAAGPYSEHADARNLCYAYMNLQFFCISYYSCSTSTAVTWSRRLHAPFVGSCPAEHARSVGDPGWDLTDPMVSERRSHRRSSSICDGERPNDLPGNPGMSVGIGPWQKS